MVALLDSGHGKAAVGGLKSALLPSMMLLARGGEPGQAMLDRQSVHQSHA
jgi:hypothetical protein